LSDALYECVAQIEPRLTVDAVVTLADLNLELLDILEKIAPFGPGNPRVKLAVTGLTLQNATVFGANQAHRRITVVDAGGQTADIIWWSGAAERLPQGTFDLAVTVSRDTYRQREAVQLTWAGMREWVVETVPIQRQLIDLRQKANALQEIDSPAALFWATDPLPGVKRFKPSGTTGTQTKKLVIWQSPPGQDVLQQLLALTQPEFIYIVAQPSKFDTLPAFMNQLMGLIKYSLTHYEGRLEIEALATALGHRSATVRLGLAWLVSQGKLRVDQLAERGDPLQSDAIVIVRPDNQPPESTSNDLKSSLLDLLRETAAYREFVRQANLAALGLAG
jgi:single-stranded-DNA-specific exonuclease